MTSRRFAAHERGVGTIEFLMVTPFVFLTVLGVIQVAYVAIANSAATDAARAQPTPTETTRIRNRPPRVRPARPSARP